MAEYSDAIAYYVDSSRVFVEQNSHSAIVVHGTGGVASQTAQQLGDYFRTNSGATSSHFGIDRAGVICQYVHLSDGAAANCCLEDGHDTFWNQFGGDNLNVHTISIEHINDSTNSLSLTTAQQDASFKLVAWLCNHYGLTADQVKTHASIAPFSRARCPGAAYPMDALKTYLSGGGSMELYSPKSPDFAQRFVDQGNNIWRCKASGNLVMGGNLAIYRTLSLTGDALPIIGLPRTNELYQKDAEDGYPWSVQFFERGLIVYDPQHRRDSQPGMGSSYLGKYSQFKELDPLYQAGHIMEKIPDNVIADVKAIVPLMATLVRDVGAGA